MSWLDCMERMGMDTTKQLSNNVAWYPSEAKQGTAVPASFWRTEAAILSDVVFELAEETALQATESGAALLQELLGAAVEIDLDLLATAASEYAKEYTFELVSMLTETGQAALQQEFAEWIISGDPLPALIDNLTAMFGPVRAEAISVTETTRIFFDSNIIAWEKYGIDSFRFNTSFDDIVCPICQPDNGKVFDLDNKDKYAPRHVRCRCWGQPVI